MDKPKKRIREDDEEEDYKGDKSKEESELSESDDEENDKKSKINTNPTIETKIPTLKPRKLVLQKYTIYETEERMYIIGSNNRETMFRILEVDLTGPIDKLNLIEDNVYFNRKEIIQILNTLEETKKLKKIVSCYGLLGFIKFTHNYYLHTITERSIVGILGGHYIYKIDSTKIIPIINETNMVNYKKNSKKEELDNEQRFFTIFEEFSLDQNFYFSYTYDITNSLQKNFLLEKFQAFKHKVGNENELIDHEETIKKILSTDPNSEKYLGNYNEMFVWNCALLKSVVQVFDRTFDWFQPIIHGFFNQANISIFNKKVYITLIARRSHHFAGARFLKRGMNDKGDVANEVETEQIVCDDLTTSFHDNAKGYYMNPRYTSFIQHRGSIPLFWTQDSNIKIAKPPISMTLNDPYYTISAIHFDKLFKRYGPKIFILNLIKQKEKVNRETILGKEFRECVEFLNQFIKEDYKLDYTAWDMSRASKFGSHGQNVLEFLENYSDKVLKNTGFFHNDLVQNSKNLQIGVCRTNCIDCLDRTNAAQFVIGKKALGHQLKQLGVYDNVYLKYDSDVVNLFTEIFHNHGNIIALQYGGSNLVNTMETYRKINQWNSKKNDLIENVKRFYSNSFVDPLRQDSINLFLGNYDFSKMGKKFLLWDLPNDFYLHNKILTNLNLSKRSFNYWWNEKVFSYWENLNFPPKNYLLNGKRVDEKLKDKIGIVLEKILSDLIYNKNGQLELRKKLTIKNEDRNLKKIQFELLVVNLRIRELQNLKLEAYPGKQMDSYWTEYYTPRRLTNFKLLFEMNMKSSLTLDASGSKFSDEKFFENELPMLNNENTSPFENKKPEINNEKFSKIYAQSCISFPNLEIDTEELQDEEVDEDTNTILCYQLNNIINKNHELANSINDGASIINQKRKSLLSFDKHEETKIDNKESFYKKSSIENKNEEKINYSHIFNLLPNNMNLNKLIYRNNQEKHEDSKTLPNDNQEISSNFSKISNPSFCHYNQDSIKALNTYESNIKSDDEIYNYYNANDYNEETEPQLPMIDEFFNNSQLFENKFNRITRIKEKIVNEGNEEIFDYTNSFSSNSILIPQGINKNSFKNYGNFCKISEDLPKISQKNLNLINFTMDLANNPIDPRDIMSYMNYKDY